jgi:hypothetical protein
MAHVLLTLALLVLATATTGAPKTLHYINDLTNTLSCDSPFHKHGAPFTTDILRASVLESPGELQALAMGLCWVPWWNSKLQPPMTHDRWFRSTFNVSDPPTTDYFAYILRNSTGYSKPDVTPQNSGDILATFASLATSVEGQNKRAALSFRIQDFQFCDREPSQNYEDLGEFWFEHRHDPAFMISGVPFPDANCKKNRATGAMAGPCNCDRDASMTWMNPAVRHYRQNMLLEAIATYPTLDVEVDQPWVVPL